MEVMNGYGYSDDLDRLEQCIEIIAKMHEVFDISLEEAAGRFDCYAQKAMGFVKSEMFFHMGADDLAWRSYYGKTGWKLQGEEIPIPKSYP